MTKHYCDVCRKELVTGEDERYLVRIEMYRHGEAIGLNDEDFDDQDDPDHLDAIDELLSQQSHEFDEHNLGDSHMFTTPTVGTQAYDLCGRCFQKYQVNPLGLERPQTGRYSTN